MSAPDDKKEDTGPKEDADRHGKGMASFFREMDEDEEPPSPPKDFDRSQQA
jgi:hypothetical protein